MQRMAHHRWDKKTGDRVRQAQDVVNGMVVPGVDALDDHIVKIQRARHARRRSSAHLHMLHVPPLPWLALT